MTTFLVVIKKKIIDLNFFAILFWSYVYEGFRFNFLFSFDFATKCSAKLFCSSLLFISSVQLLCSSVHLFCSAPLSLPYNPMASFFLSFFSGYGHTWTGCSTDPKWTVRSVGSFFLYLQNQFSEIKVSYSEVEQWNMIAFIITEHRQTLCGILNQSN